MERQRTASRWLLQPLRVWQGSGLVQIGCAAEMHMRISRRPCRSRGMGPEYCCDDCKAPNYMTFIRMDGAPSPQLCKRCALLRIDKLGKALADAEAKLAVAEAEKQRRVYYQNIVYHVCAVLDRMNGNNVSRGTGIVCGTIDEPSNQVQNAMDAFEKGCQFASEKMKAAEARAVAAEGERDRHKTALLKIKATYFRCDHWTNDPNCPWCIAAAALAQGRSEERRV